MALDRCVVRENEAAAHQRPGIFAECDVPDAARFDRNDIAVVSREATKG